MKTFASKIRFQKYSLVTIVLLFILILAGAVVRSTGSGMGCPDWPKCFGQYVPPTSINQLPKDYKQKYVAERTEKNQKFAKTLDLFGYVDLARRIREDKSILIPEEFNASKTWTEYINRLVGAISGLFLVLVAIFSFSYRGENKLIPFLSVLNILLVGFQAWLGSIVVSTNLVSGIVTLHMLLALAILAILIGTYHMAKTYGKHRLDSSPITHVVMVLTLIISTVQIVFGTEVREKIDAVSTHLQGGYREAWISNAGAIFVQHRDIAILVLLANIVLFLLIRNGFSRHSNQQQIMSFIFLIIMLQMGTGILLSYWALPPFAQALHILLASLIFGAQFYLMLNLYTSVKNQEANR
ncbi:COX15/CtaA family protein [Mucilaginibacter gotjawali]|uniref:Cytochrome c oxidase assembly protein subunit 15 n=1 Tax=Mucilaginibacter gotjawali TaxID=1550579 RepID=A0A839SCD0_9SPHI|nr:COX15/CtaA family protein [Mucilaginibacter gotjawali]MBB3054923.1 cytochrome c oxidase assembly protein subunit 15 [Mucilaginibacter gotjawali]